MSTATPFAIRRSGFTLFELLLYMALAMIMLAVMGGIGAHMLEARSKMRAQEEVRYHSFIIAERFQNAVRDASGIVSPAEGETGNTLVLSMEDPFLDPTVIEFEDGAAILTEGAGDPIVLGGSSVILEGSFTHVDTQGFPSVRLSLSVESVNAEALSAYRASTTIYSAAHIHYTP